MRLFIAIDLPDQVKNRLLGLRADIPGARWVPVEQLHLTLAFLGEVDEEQCKTVAAELGKIRSSGFKLRFNRLGCFPHHRQPRVLWAGLDPEPLLLKLVRLVQKTALDCNILPDERPFAPHITLARFKQPSAEEVGIYLGRHSLLKLEPLVVSDFFLFQSQLSSMGAVHTPLERFSLLESGKL